MWKDRLGRALMGLLVVLTMAAFVDGLKRMGVAPTNRIWIETWRTFAYLMFAGLFGLLALRPRNSPAIWELTFGHKSAVVIFGLWLGNAVPEVSLAVKMDGALVVFIATAWTLCRGWLSWTTLRAPDPGGHQAAARRNSVTLDPAPAGGLVTLVVDRRSASRAGRFWARFKMR
jgi:hypothetical protein